VSRLAAIGIATLLAAPAWAETEVLTLRYLCDRDVEVPATFVNAADVSVVVLTVDGGQITLFNEPAASGARYGWPSGGAGYVFWTKGEEATVYWREGGEETAFLSCRQMM
jgi:membrane-bound inhibitor of C-type lysozyme